MKRMLVHHARSLYRGMHHIVAELKMLPPVAAGPALQNVEDVLLRLAKIDLRLRVVAEMQFGEWRAPEETARQLDRSRREECPRCRRYE